MQRLHFTETTERCVVIDTFLVLLSSPFFCEIKVGKKIHLKTVSEGARQKDFKMSGPFVAVTLTLILGLCEGFYLPGLAPVTYCDKPSGVDHCTVS